MNKQIKKYSVTILFALLVACLTLGATFIGNNAPAYAEDTYTYATTYENAPDEYIDNWFSIAKDGYEVPLEKISYATGKFWKNFNLNTKFHFEFSINDTTEKSYQFFFGGGGWVNSYNLILSYKNDNVKLKSEQNIKTCEAVNFDLELGRIYQAEISVIQILQNDAPVGERVKAVISDGTNTVSTEYDFIGAEMCKYAKDHGNVSLNSFGFADTNSGVNSSLTLYPVIKYTYATSYEDAPNEYVDTWAIIPNEGYDVALGEITYAKGKYWEYFKLNTKFHYGFSIEDSEEKEYQFFFGGGGWANSYNFVLNYKNDKIYLASHHNKKTCDSVAFNLELGKVYQVEISLIEMYNEGALAGDSVKVIITDGVNTVTTQYEFVGKEMCGYAQDHSNKALNRFGYADATTAKTSKLKLFGCDPIKENIDGRYVYATTFENVPERRIENYFELNGAGLELNNGKQTADWYVYHQKYEKNTELKFKVNISEPETVSTAKQKYLIFFGGGTMWNSYSMVLDYGNQKVYMQNCYTPTGGSTVVMSSPSQAFPLTFGKTYSVSICLIEISDESGKPVGDSVKISITDGLNAYAISSDFFGDSRCGYAQGASDKKALGRFGFYSQNSKTEAFFKPYEYKRDFALNILTEERNVLIELQYGDSYDFTSYAKEVPFYELSHFKAMVDGKEVNVAPSGIWETDILIKAGGVYSAVLTPEYKAIEYGLTYNVTNASMPSYAPAVITADKPVTLVTPINVADGYVFMGWYLDSGCTQKVDKITCAGEDVEVFAKIVEGYNFTLEMPSGNIEIAVEKNQSLDLTSITEQGYKISGWQEFNGSEYVALSGNSVVATANKTLKPVASKVNYTVTYDLDGGTNDSKNPTSFTVDDEFTFVTPEKAGYLFVKFVDQSGNVITGIEKGTSENLTVKAIFVKDEFVSNVSVFVSESAQDVPIFVIPETAVYTVSVKYGEEPVEVQNGKAVFNKVGNYTAVYTVELFGGKTVEKTVTIESKKLTIKLDGAYQSAYKKGDEILLLDAYSEKVNAVITVQVFKGDKEISYKDFCLELSEKGNYTIRYTIQNETAEVLDVNIKVKGGFGYFFQCILDFFAGLFS